MPLLPPEVAESTYATVLQNFSIADLPPAERIKKLKETDREGWVSKLGPGLPLSPVADKNESKPPFYQAGVPDDAVSPPGNDWCPRIMMGDCELDVSFDLCSGDFSLFRMATDELLVLNPGLHARPWCGAHRDQIPRRPRQVPGR